MWRPKPSRDELPPAARLPSQPVPLARPGSNGRAWLDVPYDEKDRAKSSGARWDPQARRWYAPGLVTADLQRWAPLPQLLPAEDRSYGPGLFVDLVPSTCWFSNVRTCVQPASWDRIRTTVYGRADDRCEAWGRPADRAAGLRMEAHERWAYDPARRVQSLRRLVCLCGACHGVTHLGRTPSNWTGKDRVSGQLRGSSAGSRSPAQMEPTVASRPGESADMGSPHGSPRKREGVS